MGHSVLPNSLVDPRLQEPVLQEYVADVTLNFDGVDLLNLLLLFVLKCRDNLFFLSFLQRGEFLAQILVLF